MFCRLTTRWKVSENAIVARKAVYLKAFDDSGLTGNIFEVYLKPYFLE